MALVCIGSRLRPVLEGRGGGQSRRSRPSPRREGIAAQEDGRPVGIVVTIPSPPLPPLPSSSSYSHLNLFSPQFRRSRSSCRRVGSADSGCRASRFTIRPYVPSPAAAYASSKSSYSSFVDPPSLLGLGRPPGSFLHVVEYHDDGPREVARYSRCVIGFMSCSALSCDC